MTVSVWPHSQRDRVTSAKPVRTTRRPPRPTTDHPMPRHMIATAPSSRRICTTEGCSRELQERISGRCYVCGNNHRRFAHPLQEAPLDSTLSTLIRRAET